MDLLPQLMMFLKAAWRVALAESTFDTAGLGASVTLTGPETAALFSESQSRFILSVKQENQTAFEAIVADAVLIGRSNC